LSIPPPPPIMSPELLDEIKGYVEREFRIEQMYIEFGIPTCIIAEAETKEPFSRLATSMKARGLTPVLRRDSGRLVIKVFPRLPSRPSKVTINLVLLIATGITIFLDGYISWANSPVLEQLMPGYSQLLLTGVYAVSLLAIVGLHEVGHKLACMKSKIEATLPYFIPGIPGLGFGTFGAVIMQKEPPVNREQLFDMGFSGPLVGFILSTIIASIGISQSFLVPLSDVENWAQQGLVRSLPSSILLNLLADYIKPAPAGQVLLFHPLVLAGWFGMLLTSLNLFPAWQLDGGHVARAALSEKPYTYLSYISLAAMFIAGYQFMALLIFFMMWRSKTVGPLDDVSPIGKSRKVLAIAMAAIFFLCFTQI
jgi:Zn-dependent protease